MADLLLHLRDHIALALSALTVALLLAVPAGAAVAQSPRWREPLLGAFNVARVVPSLAVLALMLPLIGIGFRPALVALTLLALPPIAINTELGLRGVPPALIEAARGLGMSERQIRRRISWPLALPVVFSGIKTAAVEVIASATLAAFIGGGGLGEYITSGLSTDNTAQLLLGSLSVALLTLGVDAVLGTVQRRMRVRT
jgi:osmoprotectant transport system permease protein